MKVYPLKSISIDQAKEIQFKIVDEISRVFRGSEMLTLGDLGLKQPENQPKFTLKAEKAIAGIFGAEMSKLVTGSGTGAIRYALHAVFKGARTRKILVHTAPIYPTTQTTFEMLNLEVVLANFNDLNDIKNKIIEHADLKCALVQISRQNLDDFYNAKEVIKTIKLNQNIKIITDDNYAVFKTGTLGSQIGADLATFSTFKVLGPEGVGCIVGKEKLIEQINNFNYSGGSQIQGWQSYEVLQGMIISPVMFAIQAKENEKLVEYIKNTNIKGVKNVFLVNAQSKVLIVEMEKPIAKKVLENAELLGALPNPVGAESKYEFLPLFYRVSSTFRKTIPNADEFLIRINPNRAGFETVLRILKGAIEDVFK